MPVERTAEIAASPETIWTYLGQLERWPEWDADIKSGLAAFEQECAFQAVAFCMEKLT